MFKKEKAWEMEIIKPIPPHDGLRFALFDFDGTISLIREGWQEIMIPYFIEVLLQTPKAESKEIIEENVTLFVDTLTGKQTIFQCIRLDEEVVQRGGPKTAPGVYKAEYLRRLGERIKDRLKELQDGCDPQEYLVPGSVRLLELLKNEGYNLYLASGTDEPDVLAEAKLLGLGQYFDKHIYGARDNETVCSKETIIKRILAENNLNGTELISFGDGFVEIELVAKTGGYSIGVATDEVRKMGINKHKRKRLLEAGAAMIISDFSNAEGLLSYLSGKEVS
jgi:phosphoglycolate phosphatase-like HAD superfamily hydrolase